MLERRVEEASLNAWPGLRQVLLDGWVLRFSRGYTKRANSVNPLYPSALGLTEKVDLCEELYRAAGLPCVFRLARPFAPQGLDALLEARGYLPLDPTLVLHLDLRTADLPEPPAGLREEPLDAWFPLHCRLSGTDPARAPTHRDILEAIAARRATFTLAGGDGGEDVACGLGVLEGGVFGLFDLVTAAERRGRGHGAALVGGMLRWARERGATHAYLQVVEANAPARRLYDRLGFRRLYGYAYRVAPG